MNNEIKIVEKEIGHIAEITYHIPIMKMATSFKKAYQKITDFLEDKQVETRQAPFSRYTDLDWNCELKKSKWKMLIEIFTKKYHIHIGIPMVGGLEGKEDIKTHYIEKATYISTIHYGPYHNLAQTYANLMVWAQENNYHVKAESIEIYLNDPRETDKEKLQTEVLVPLAS